MRPNTIDNKFKSLLIRLLEGMIQCYHNKPLRKSWHLSLNDDFANVATMETRVSNVNVVMTMDDVITMYLRKRMASDKKKTNKKQNQNKQTTFLTFSGLAVVDHNQIPGWTQQKCFISSHTLFVQPHGLLWSSPGFVYLYNSLCSCVDEMHWKASNEQKSASAIPESCY